jgi:hypothetical protein
MNNQKSIKVTYNFLNLNQQIYALCKNLNFYTVEEYNRKFNLDETWPGKRTFELSQESPFLYIHLLSLLERNGIEIHKYKRILAHCCIRIAEDKDWIHMDESDTALIYLSPTNINSGTKFFDSQNNEITSVQFVQNTCVFFESPLPHSSFGNHGDTIDNARMTFNIFFHK